VTGIALAGGAVAQAHEINPSWGYAFIDDNPSTTRTPAVC